MSYDLTFRPPVEPDDADARFAAYFADRPHYTMQGRQAWYENGDTGVYFSFETYGNEDPLAELEIDIEDDPDAPPCWASFNLNLFRPHVFALEAAPEIRAFVEAMQVAMDDPQLGTTGAFDGDAFVDSWTSSNRSAARAAVAQGIERPDTRSAADIERVWRWNLGRAALQERLGDDIFVPKISYFGGPDGVRTGCVWTDAMPVALPDTDIVVLYRDELAAKRFFRTRDQTTIVERTTLDPLLAAFPAGDDPGPHRMLAYASPPAEIVQAFRSAPPTSLESVTMPGTDQVLDAALFED